MNIPKKLEDTRWQSTHFAIEDLENKINELIDYLQANKPVGCCCIKKHSTGEVSKKDKYLCYTCNQWGIVGEHECEASKGECDHDKDLLCERCFHPNPPEHEESWEKEIRDENWDTEAGIMTKQVYLRHGRKIGTATTPLKVEMIIDYIKANFVSKEKIKRELTSKLSYAWCKELFNSLGLGD